MSIAARFKTGDTVVLRATREVGRIEGDPVRSAGEYWYRVRFVERADRVVEEDLDALDATDDSLRDLAVNGRWGRLQALRCALAIERILHANRSTLYSFKSQRILFEPYQYKPLIKILDSPDRRLLIADEVGLGKTIESGLILRELEARKALDRVLIVCPSRLRDKWREELNRKFDLDFEIFDKRSFLDYLIRVRDNPRRTRMRGIVSMQTMRNGELRESMCTDLEHIDFVIFDEAHHCRNPSSQTSDLLRELCEVGDCVLLLTATPIHLASRDLFTLLAALRPAEFRDAEVFDRDLKRHAALHAAGRLIRNQRAELLPVARTLLEQVFVDGVLPDLRDPLAVQVIEDLQSLVPVDRRGWVELERRIQELHPLSSVITRTRKRDVQEHAPLRKAGVYHCQWTSEEDELYQRLVDGTTSHGWIREQMSFGQIQRARQAASCLPAVAEAQGLSIADVDDEAVDQCDISPSELPGIAKGKPMISPASPIAMTGRDSKYEKLSEIFKQIWQAEPNAKVLVFTFFVGTSKYLERRLNELGAGVLRIAGDVRSNPRQPDQDERGIRMRRFREDPSVRVMVSTEVGSEGLDFQFCHHVVNYDLPWNPMVVEQRIGRIDRFGQESDVIYIHNLVVDGTVEEKILLRLYNRIGIFERSIGDLEAILGETISELQRDYITGKLTPGEAERRVEQAALAVEQRRLHLQKLEENAGELFGHEEYLRDEMNRVSRLGRFINEESFLAVLQTFLESHHPSIRMWSDEEGIWALRLTDALRHQIQDASRKSGQLWIDRTRDGQLRLTLRGDVAFRQPEIELVNVGHPLIQAAVEALRSQLDAPVARIGQAVLHLSDEEDSDLPQGTVFLTVFQLTVEGIRARRVLETLGWAENSTTLLEGELGERLLYLVLERGIEWDHKTAASGMPDHVWEMIETETLGRTQALREQEQRENDALYRRRQGALRAEYEHDRAIKEQRLRTAEAHGHQRVVPALRGQIQKSETEYRGRVEELESTKQVSVRFSSEPIAVCVVDVRRIS